MLEGITHVPAGLSLRVFQALRQTHGEAMSVGGSKHRVLAPDTRPITVQNKHKRCTILQSVWQIHRQLAHVAVHLHRVIDKVPRLTRQSQQECPYQT